MKNHRHQPIIKMLSPHATFRLIQFEQRGVPEFKLNGKGHRKVLPISVADRGATLAQFTRTILLTMALVGVLRSETVSANDPAAYNIQKTAAETADHFEPIESRAKNIILFIGDGMGISTVTAGRILDGQLQGGQGEDHSFSFESFPFTALSKTYATNLQIPDSASTMTAMMTGHKTKGYTIGYDKNVVVGDHTSVEEFGGPAKKLETLLERFEKEGRSTGIVTTARVTDATPAACYAHTPNRLWEGGNFELFFELTEDERMETAISAGFKDTATQLIDFPFGDGVDVVLGGGWRNFFPLPLNDQEPSTAAVDDLEERAFPQGTRLDEKNLIKEWLDRESGRAFVTNKVELSELDLSKTSQLMGLFDKRSMPFEVSSRLLKEKRSAPSLQEMALTALSVVRRNPKGFFLMVEGGRIDHGHHFGSAHLALMEMIELDRAIESLLNSLTEKEQKETLIIVTADHSHVFTMGGYPTRGNPILGKVTGADKDGTAETELESDAIGLPFTTLGYANGPGFAGMMIETNTLDHVHGPRLITQSAGWKFINAHRSARPDLTLVDTKHPEYRQESAVPLSYETHSGEDVPVYATGPGAHLFRGTRNRTTSITQWFEPWNRIEPTFAADRINSLA